MLHFPNIAKNFFQIQESLKIAGSLTYTVGFVDFDLHRHLEIFYIEMAVINLTYEKWPILPSITDWWH